MMLTHQSAADLLHKSQTRSQNRPSLHRGSTRRSWRRHPPLSSRLTVCRSAGQLLLTVMVGVAIPLLPPYTSSTFPDTGSWNKPTRGQN